MGCCCWRGRGHKFFAIRLMVSASGAEDCKGKAVEMSPPEDNSKHSNDPLDAHIWETNL